MMDPITLSETSSCRTFFRDTQGVAAVEFALILPLLLLILLGSVTLFDFYRTGLALDRATATVSDFMSRQTELSENFMTDRVKTSLQGLVPHEGNQIDFRVTSFTMANGSFMVDWTYQKYVGSGFDGRPLPTNLLPLVTEGDSVLLTETTVTQSALFDIVGAASIAHRATVAVRPRFTNTIKGPV